MAAALSEDLLGQLPTTLRKELFVAYNDVLKNYREQRWEPSELNGGKLCGVAYTILRGHIDGVFPEKSTKPGNMVDACRALENAPSSFPRSVRIQIPRMLVALYEVRNNRGVGHVGGDVNPNHMDSTCVLHMSKWILSELIRAFHKIDTQTATAAVESLAEKIVPIVWQVQGKLRVLNMKLTMKQKALVLLYHTSGPVKEPQLFEWVEHSNASIFRRDVLRKAHEQKLLEYNANAGCVEISPNGISLVEELLLNHHDLVSDH